MQTCLIWLWAASINSFSYFCLCCSIIDLARSIWVASNSGLHCSTSSVSLDFQNLSNCFVKCFSDLKALNFSVWHCSSPLRHCATFTWMLLWVMISSRIPLVASSSSCKSSNECFKYSFNPLCNGISK